MDTTTKRNEGGRYSSKSASNWYADIEAANIQAVEDAERTLVTALATQVGNAVAAMPDAAERIRKAAKLVQSREVWSLTGGSFLVGSDSDSTGAYLVTRGGGWACECGDYKGRKRICKHQLAAMLTVKMGAAYQPSYT